MGNIPPADKDKIPPEFQLLGEVLGSGIEQVEKKATTVMEKKYIEAIKDALNGQVCLAFIKGMGLALDSKKPDPSNPTSG